MRSLLISCFLLGLCATSWVSAVKYRDLELGSVVIDDSSEDVELEEEATTTQASVSEEGAQACTSSNGEQGTCIAFGQCFPYLYDSNSDNFTAFQLYNILKESVQPCEGGSDLICCPDYSYGLPTRKPQFAGQTTQAPAQSNATTGISKNRNNENCGKNNYQDTKVVGGRVAYVKEFPYAVALTMRGRQFCGASLISDQWVLTAAHCIANLKSFSGVSVNVGDHDVTKPSEVQHQARGVKKGFYNKGFSFRNLQHDIALLQLDRPVTYSDSVQPVCLSNTPPPYGEQGVLSGWGKTAKNQPPSPVLRTVKMRVIPHDECKKIYATEPQAPPITTGMVCAGEGHGQNRRDACNGDSGGPLVRFDNGKAIQFGVVSFGIGCGEKAGVYTRVDQYLTWIDKNSKRA